MEYIFVALDWFAALLVAVALAMIAFGSAELQVAKLLSYVVGAIIFIRWLTWALTVESSWWVRVIIGAIVGIILFAAIPEFLKWISARSETVLKTKTASTTSIPQSLTQN